MKCYPDRKASGYKTFERIVVSIEPYLEVIWLTFIAKELAALSPRSERPYACTTSAGAY
jgi:hypothetical protein